MKKSVIKFATLTIIAAVFCTGIISCDDDDDPKVGPVIPPITTPVTGIEINKDVLSIVNGDANVGILTVKAFPEEATLDTIIWSMNSDTVAYINRDGAVSAVKPGYAKIYARTRNAEFIDSCKLYVTNDFVPVTKLSVKQKMLNVRMNQTRTLTYRLAEPDSATTAQTVNWYSNDENIVTIDKESGKITPVGIGTTKVYAANEDMTVSDSCTINILKIKIDVTSVKIAKKVLAAHEGTSDTLRGVSLPDSASVQGVKWYSDNESIITIDSITGKYNAITKGDANIIARSIDNPAIYSVCKVKVYNDDFCFVRFNNVKEDIYYEPGKISEILDGQYVDAIEFISGYVLDSDLDVLKTKLAGRMLMIDLKDVELFKASDKSPITCIPAEYFRSFPKINKILLPKNITSIPDEAFKGLKSLLNVTMPDSLTTIGNNAFEGTVNMTSIKLAENLETIGDFCFFESGLKYVEIPDKVTAMGNQAFGRCAKLDSIQIGKSLNIELNNPMKACNSLIKIKISEENQNLVVVNSGMYSHDTTQLFCYPAGRTLKKVELAENTKNLVAGSLYGAKMFNIILNENIKEIRTDAIKNCPNLEKLTIKATEPPMITPDFLTACDSLKIIEVPNADTYKSSPWGKFSSKIVTENQTQQLQ